MATVNTTAGKLKVGDLIDFAGVEFVLVKSSGYGGFVTLELNTVEVKDRVNTDMFIDCRSTIPFTRVVK